MSESDKTTQYTAFRLAEKHFKNRASRDKLPSLRKYQDTLVDLSRPHRQEDDPLWHAGWWSPLNDADVKSASWMPWTFGKGKERDKGERPELSISELKEIQLKDGKVGWIVEPETEPGSVIGYEEIVARNKSWTGDIPSDKLKEKTVSQLMGEIRWANLGWVYQWSTKSYDLSREIPIPFPPELAKICRKVSASVPWAEVWPAHSCGWETWEEDYAPDTGIVNFYQEGQTLMAHVDRSELDPARPLVSLSLGHSAILLLGTTSRQDPPRPIVLRSGDCLIMSGNGRQAYHGVPRILEGTLPSHFGPLETDTDSMAAIKRFISSARININARQVFPPGFQRRDIT
ncbi:alkylated DNA repair protein AlkB [Kwoniella dendrophila CBS 6074]|uniref:Alkylated DNA repair protein AlkB n=1 Tax=Kwoniella dendrophila CBS 6074 TaxID=1295534 RepID=A0AAX4JLQ9_9TREE